MKKAKEQTKIVEIIKAASPLNLAISCMNPSILFLNLYFGKEILGIGTFSYASLQDQIGRKLSRKDTVTIR